LKKGSGLPADHVRRSAGRGGRYGRHDRGVGALRFWMPCVAWWSGQTA